MSNISPDAYGYLPGRGTKTLRAHVSEIMGWPDRAKYLAAIYWDGDPPILEYGQIQELAQRADFRPVP